MQLFQSDVMNFSKAVFLRLAFFVFCLGLVATPDLLWAKLPTVWVEGTLEEVRKAIASGEKVNAEAGSFTPLMAVASDTTNGVEKAKILLKAGADLNAKGPGNTTALLEAITKNNYPVALLLMSAGAKPYSTTDAGQTALITAITAVPGLTSFKSDDAALQSQIEAWQLLMESRTKPNSVAVEKKPSNEVIVNPPEGYTEIFGGNLVFKIPSYLAEKIYYKIYFHMDGQKPVSMLQKPVSMQERMFSNPADGAVQFKSLYDETLEFRKKFHDDPVGEYITDQLNQPGFLVTTVCRGMVPQNLEDIPPNDGKKLKMYLPSSLDAYLKLAQGYLNFYMRCDYGTKDLIHDQDKMKQNLNDRKSSILTVIKELMPHYKWVGDEAVTIGSNYRTRFGLINQAGLYLNPKFYFGIDYLEDPTMQMFLTVSTHEWSYRNTHWLSYLLQNFKAHDGQEAKELSIAFPRKVYGRWGMQLVRFDVPISPSVVLSWTEFPTTGSGSHDPLFIDATFYRPPPGKGLQPDFQPAWDLWNNILDNIEVSP